ALNSGVCLILVFLVVIVHLVSDCTHLTRCPKLLVRITIIESLHIDPKHQGRGLGRLLVKEMATWIERYFPDNGVYLEVLEKNQQAIDFYDHIGGELLTEKMWHAPGGVDVPERVYSWKTPKALMAAME
ncbi:GNAT family N-acetyltransferase, partial [Vibrio fluvialis]|nr:GNAT family N-acetyltransferase [Vibrio fluvialis]